MTQPALYLSEGTIEVIIRELRQAKRQRLEEEKVYDGYIDRLATAARIEGARVDVAIEEVLSQITLAER